MYIYIMWHMLFWFLYFRLLVLFDHIVLQFATNSRILLHFSN